MKKILSLGWALFLVLTVVAQKDNTSVTTKNDITVIFESQDSSLNPATQQGLLDIIFKVYPKLVTDFNSAATKELRVKIDTAYNGVAYAQNDKVTISSKWLDQRPEDLDLMTHELMHIVQSYPAGTGPGWLTEGIADYVRHVYGVDNARAKWSLPHYDSNQNYSDSYRITARFLVWMTQRFDEKLVKNLDHNLRNKTYSPESWKQFSGKTLDELWSLYKKDPVLL